MPTYENREHMENEFIALHCLSKAFGNPEIYRFERFDPLDAWSVLNLQQLPPPLAGRYAHYRVGTSSLALCFISEVKCRSGRWEKWPTYILDVDKYDELMKYVGSIPHCLFIVRTLGDDRIHVVDVADIDLSKVGYDPCGGRICNGRIDAANDAEPCYYVPRYMFREVTYREPFFELVQREKKALIKMFTPIIDQLLEGSN